MPYPPPGQTSTAAPLARTFCGLHTVIVGRETFWIRKVVLFEAGQQSSTLRVERLDRNQGLTEVDVITLPSRGVETIRG